MTYEYYAFKFEYSDLYSDWREILYIPGLNKEDAISNARIHADEIKSKSGNEYLIVWPPMFISKCTAEEVRNSVLHY